MNTVRKGDISFHTVIAKLLKEGFNISRPITENSRYDLLVDNGKNIYRVQVKTIYMSKAKRRYGQYMMACYSANQNIGRKKYTSDEVDFIIGCNEHTHEVYIFPIDDIDGRVEISFNEKRKSKNQYNPIVVSKYLDAYHLLKADVSERSKESDSKSDA